MNLLHIIQARIGDLKEQESKLQAEITATIPKSLSEEYGLLYAWRKFAMLRAELETILASLLESGRIDKDPAPVVPFAGAKIGHTPEEVEAYKIQLIVNGLSFMTRASSAQIESRYDNAITYFSDLLQYSTTLAAGMFVKGFIEQLEGLETLATENPYAALLKEKIDKALHDNYTTLQTLADNCDILAEKLNLEK